MKKLILKGAILIAVALNITGCSSKTEDGLNIPSSSVYEKNSKTKIYYEDNLDAGIKKNLEDLSKYINSHELESEFKITNKPDSGNFEKFCLSMKTSKNSDFIKFSQNSTFDSKRNIIIINKKYTTKEEIYADYFTIKWSLSKAFRDNNTLQDELGTSSNIIIEDSLANTMILAFTIKKEIARRAILDKPIRQLELGGYKRVSTPEEADRLIYFDLTRDYKKSELAKMKNEGKGINYSVASAGNNTQLMTSTMNFASHTNNAGTSIAAGVGAGLVLDAIMSSNYDYSFSFPSMKIVDKKANKSYIQLFQMGFSQEIERENDLSIISNIEVDNFITRIHSGMNRFTDSIMFDHIPLN